MVGEHEASSRLFTLLPSEIPQTAKRELLQQVHRLPLAAALWPGDEDLPGRAAILFDASASHYLTTDGLALLGSGLASRLLRTASSG